MNEIPIQFENCIKNNDILENKLAEKLELKNQEEICNWSKLQTLLKQEKLLYLREILEHKELTLRNEKKLKKYYMEYIKYDFFIHSKFLFQGKKSANKNLYSTPIYTIKNIEEALNESKTFFLNISEYIMENTSLLFKIIEQENLMKNQENEKLFIRLFAFYYLNSYESKEKKTIFLELIIDLIEIEVSYSEKIDDLYSRNTLTQKLLFSFLLQPKQLHYPVKHIKYAFFKILQELEYSDLDKLMDMRNIEKILDEIFSIFLSTSHQIPFLIRFFCFASLKLCEKKFPEEIETISQKKKFLTNIFIVKWLLPTLIFQDYGQDDFLNSEKFENFLQIQSHLSSLIRFIFKGEDTDPFTKDYFQFIEKKREKVDEFYEEFLSIELTWKNVFLEKHSSKNRENPIFNYHFCISYKNLAVLTEILKKRNDLPPLIIKNLNYLRSYLKSEILQKYTLNEMENIFFIVNCSKLSLNSSIESILQEFEKKEKDCTKDFLNHLILNEDDSAILEDFFLDQKENHLNPKRSKKLLKKYENYMRISQDKTLILPKETQTNEELLENIMKKENLTNYYKRLSNEYNERFQLYRNYLEVIKGSIILNQNLLKLNKKKIIKLMKNISRDEITIRIMHFLENTRFNYTITKNSKNKYAINFEGENFLKVSFMTIRSLFKNSNSKYLKE